MAEVERLRTANLDDAAELGALMTHLSENYDGAPVSIVLLESLIASPVSDQLVARQQGRIVGAATLHALYAPVGSKAWLEDFVTDPSVRGQGLGRALWMEIEVWCQERSLPLQFLSHPKREDAHVFYKRQGAIALSTTAFRKDF
jgi:GNAT superfamily N-acetyltransferase